ncbi:MAG: serine/threonine protein kinase [Deltaproteobacteria bacterium]|nr:serine/threonine protein kinase [Deltaproteobacteria bacterium]
MGGTDGEGGDARDDVRSDPRSLEETHASDEHATARGERGPAASGELHGQLGRYVVHGTLGVGAMGVVYSAFDPELDRAVALKLLHARGGAGAAGGRRLLREAQAMARLTSPNVVTVHDVGTIGGRVFVAMEQIDGGTLTQWQRAPERTWSEIVAMYLDAGRGLVAAHDAGIVHGDFKPDNVLIGRDGRARVGDFGLARVLDRSSGMEPTDEVPPTDAGARGSGETSVHDGRAGTPAYMAPEQHLGGEPGPAADQFAFCVALYEALYGVRPFRAASLTALVIAVCEREPEPPPADGRVPRWVWPLLRRGLAKRVDERHPSLSALLDRLSRDPRARRRRFAIAAVALGATGGAAWFTARATASPTPCRGAAAAFAPSWNDATRDALRHAFEGVDAPYAADALRHTTSLLEGYAGAWVEAHGQACRATSIDGVQSEQVLDERMQCLARAQQSFDALVARMAAADVITVRESVTAVGRLPALDACSETATLGQRTPLPTEPERRQAIESLQAQLAQVHAADISGHPRDAAEQLATMLPQARTLGYPPLLAETLHIHGQLATKDGGDDGEAALEEALWTALRGGDDRLAATIAIDLLRQVGYVDARVPEGERWFALASALLDRHGAAPALTVKLFVAHGAMRLEQRDFDGAASSFERAREAAAQLQPDDRERALVTTALANLTFLRDDVDAAMPLYEEAAASFERLYGPHHPTVGDLQSNIGNVWWARDEPATARLWYERAMANLEAAYGPDHPEVASVLAHIALTHAQEGHPELARPQLERAVAIFERHFGPEHPELIMPLHDLGLALTELHEPVAAERALRRAIAVQERAYGLEYPELVGTLVALSDVLVLPSQQDERRRVLVRARAIAAAAPEPDPARLERLDRRIAELPAP